jgi:hypothetical protein
MYMWTRMKCLSVCVELHKHVARQKEHSCTPRCVVALQFIFNCRRCSCVRDVSTIPICYLPSFTAERCIRIFSQYLEVLGISSPLICSLCCLYIRPTHCDILGVMRIQSSLSGMCLMELLTRHIIKTSWLLYHNKHSWDKPRLNTIICLQDH